MLIIDYDNLMILQTSRSSVNMPLLVLRVLFCASETRFTSPRESNTADGQWLECCSSITVTPTVAKQALRIKRELIEPSRCDLCLGLRIWIRCRGPNTTGLQVNLMQHGSLSLWISLPAAWVHVGFRLSVRAPTASHSPSTGPCGRRLMMVINQG